MITTDEAARLLTSEIEDCVQLLGGRTVGGGLCLESVRVAIGQTGEVEPEQSFLLTGAGEGRPGWVVEVRLHARAKEPENEDLPSAVPVREGATPLVMLGEGPTTILRGVNTDTARELSKLGIDTVAQLAALPEQRLPDLVSSEGFGMRLLDAWSRAQLLRLPLVATSLGELADWTLAQAAGSSPAQLRAAGVPAVTSDTHVEQFARALALLGAALDLHVLRSTTVSMIVRGLRGR